MILLKEELRRTVEWYRYEGNCWALYAEVELGIDINLAESGRRAYARKQAILLDLSREEVESSYKIVDIVW